MLRLHMELVMTTGVTGMTYKWSKQSDNQNNKYYPCASSVDSNFLSVRHNYISHKNWLLLKYISENVVRFPQPIYTFYGE